MKEFKFLTSTKMHPRGRFFSHNHYSGIRFGNGDIITVYPEELAHGINRLQYPSFVIISFRWERNFNASEMLGMEYNNTYIENYEGPIDGFYNHYSQRRYVFRETILPHIPVIQRIECNGSNFHSESLTFNNPNQHVIIGYKKFL